MSASAEKPILDIENVSVSFPGKRNWYGRVVDRVTALQQVSLQIRKGETLGIIGESGCGKSTLAKVILGMLAPDTGVIRMDGVKLKSHPDLATRRRLASSRQLIFQDPQSSLDPRFRIWELITEFLEIEGSAGKQHRFDRASELAAKVGVTQEQLQRYPHELSGGQRQRVAVARALAIQPQLLVLDEPTSALDVTIQAQVLNLLLSLQQEFALTYLFISHDVGVIRHICDRVAVMYRGRIVESGYTEQVLTEPRNDYTRTLIDSVPKIGKR